ncbi:MAG: ATP-binding cassette domain-containing protein [Patescibacteria group bacterium]
MSKKDLRNIFSACKIVYQIDPLAVAVESSIFISNAFLVMYRISLFGTFLDHTVDYIDSVDSFVFVEYIYSPSFYSFAQLFGLWLITSFLMSLKRYFQSRLKIKYKEEMPARVVEKIADLNMEDVERKEFRDLLSNINNYAFSRILDTYMRVRQFFHQLVKMGSAAFFVFRINPWLPLGAFLLVLPEIIYKFRSKVAERKFLDESVERRKLADYIYREATRLRNFPELKVDRVFDFFLSIRESVTQELTEGVDSRRYDQYVKSFAFSVFDQFLFRGLLIALVAMAVVQNISVGIFQALFNYMRSLYSSSLALWDRLSSVGDNSQYIEDYLNFIEFTGFGDVSTGYLHLDAEDPSVSVQDLTFTYQGWKEPIFKDMNFFIEGGGKAGFVGEDGAGGTTLAKLLCGLYRIRKGDILYDGKSIKDLKRGELKENISAHFDAFVKYDLSFCENIVLSSSGTSGWDFDPDLYKQVLYVTGLDSWLEETGLDDSQKLGKSLGQGAEISQGYWQRIALARTLYRNSSVFILDNPLAYVDAFSRREIYKRLLAFVGDRTLLVMLNTLEVARYFDYAFLLENKKAKELQLGSTQ